jgi:hypothetical protein
VVFKTAGFNHSPIPPHESWELLRARARAGHLRDYHTSPAPAQHQSLRTSDRSGRAWVRRHLHRATKPALRPPANYARRLTVRAFSWIPALRQAQGKLVAGMTRPGRRGRQQQNGLPRKEPTARRALGVMPTRREPSGWDIVSRLAKGRVCFGPATNSSRAGHRYFVLFTQRCARCYNQPQCKARDWPKP